MPSIPVSPLGEAIDGGVVCENISQRGNTFLSIFNFVALKLRKNSLEVAAHVAVSSKGFINDQTRHREKVNNDRVFVYIYKESRTCFDTLAHRVRERLSARDQNTYICSYGEPLHRKSFFFLLLTPTVRSFDLSPIIFVHPYTIFAHLQSSLSYYFNCYGVFLPDQCILRIHPASVLVKCQDKPTSPLSNQQGEGRL